MLHSDLDDLLHVQSVNKIQGIDFSFVDNKKCFPLVITSRKNSVDASQWIKENKTLFERLLFKFGAVLLRDFNEYNVEKFQNFVEEAFGRLLNYHNRSTPRTRISGKIYSSTEYPNQEIIPQHNENSYSHEWPNNLFFLCVIAPKAGGETPLSDSRSVYRKIPVDIRAKFERLGVMYVRNLSERVGLPWQEVFQMSDRTQLRKYCALNKIDCEWLDSSRLRIKQVLPATSTHKITR